MACWTKWHAVHKNLQIADRYLRAEPYDFTTLASRGKQQLGVRSDRDIEYPVRESTDISYRPDLHVIARMFREQGLLAMAHIVPEPSGIVFAVMGRMGLLLRRTLTTSPWQLLDREIKSRLITDEFRRY